MIRPIDFVELLTKKDVSFFSGVPDSLLKDICACITDTLPPSRHIIAANEGGAVGLAIGHFLATDEIPLVYFQNSGLGNVVNPLLSLASQEVYGIPMLFMIGWRGEPGVNDEPQHVVQGKVMLDMLDVMGVPYRVLPDNLSEAQVVIEELTRVARDNNSPVALVVQKGTFEPYNLPKISSSLSMSRGDAVAAIASAIPDKSVVVCTTGMASRELYEYRVDHTQSHQTDFLTVGGMGHASQIALGIANASANQTVVCLDGDGAALMHMGSLAIIGQSQARNLVHIVLNNGVHGSVGGQPTVAFDISIPGIANASGYLTSVSVSDESSLRNSIETAVRSDGPVLIEVKVRPENRKNIGRPKSSPAENKADLMNFLNDDVI